MDRKVFFATRLGTEPIKYLLVCNNTGNEEIAGGTKTAFYSISPTGAPDFHIPKKFGELKFKCML